jgi:hypothetical protein
MSETTLSSLISQTVQVQINRFPGPVFGKRLPCEIRQQRGGSFDVPVEFVFRVEFGQQLRREKILLGRRKFADFVERFTE